ncbi:hypothetical protein BHE74_00016631 [Ensete ventricosum]|nr:hypothetical protein BHE74_00016631 [Ensete ventricosum]
MGLVDDCVLTSRFCRACGVLHFATCVFNAGSHDSYSEKKQGVPSMRLLPSQGNHDGCAELFSCFGKANDCEAQRFSTDALEAGLRCLLHPVIEVCLEWWGISPSQMAPNSWRYIVAFLEECRGVSIVST